MSAMHETKTKVSFPLRNRAALLLAICCLALVVPRQTMAEVPEQFAAQGSRAHSHPYLGDPELSAPGTAAVEAVADEAQRGFVVFAKSASVVIPPDHLPGRDERCVALAARDCPGQYGPITFAVFAIEGGEFAVSVTDLSGPGGKTLSADNLDVRTVRYAKVSARGKTEVIPLLLERIPRMTVAARRAQQFWITYYLPPVLPAGDYVGKVRILVGGIEKMSLPLTITVHPFSLAEADAEAFIYFENSTEAGALPLMRKQIIDQRCHAMNSSTLTLPVTTPGELVRDATVQILDMYRDVHLARPDVHVGLWNRMTAEWLNTPDKSIRMYGPWFRYYPFSDKLDAHYVEAVRFIDQECRKRGLKLVLSVADEAGSHPWTAQAAQHYNDLIKQKLPEVTRELTCGGGWAMKLPEDELWKGRLDLWMTNRWLVDKLELVRRNEPQAKIGIYNMCGPGSGPGGIEAPRVVYGFFAWKSKAAAVAQWVYYHNSTPEHEYAWPAENADEGNVPTLRWEMVREGAKDRRYLATLEAKLAGAKGPVAEQARQLLSRIEAAVELRNEDYDPIGGGRVPVPMTGTCDQWRGQIAEMIRKL
ncbi:MAG: hypothetical protein ACHRHE_13875 [Tepidisphaerales bacterium]